MVGSGIAALCLLPIWIVGVDVSNFVIDYCEYYIAWVCCRFLVGTVAIEGKEVSLLT